MKATRANRKLGIRIEFDKEQIFKDDPGQGTPVLVCLESGETGTWNCVTSEGEVDGVALSPEQKEWLDGMTPEVERWIERYC